MEIAISPSDDLALICQEDTGNGHDQYDGAGQASDCEVDPEESFSHMIIANKSQ